MKSLIFKSQHLCSQDIELAIRPAGIERYIDFSPEPREFHNIVQVWLCVEKGDTEEDVAKLVERIEGLNESSFHLRHIVVVPFGHLSKRLAPPETAVSLIAKACDELRAKALEVDKLSFGTHKDFEAEMSIPEINFFESNPARNAYK